MKRLIEILTFVALAVGVHLALLMRFDTRDGAEAGGQGGAAMVSIAAAAASIETMVAEWQAAPAPYQTAPRLIAPTTAQPETAPTRPDTRPDLAPVRMAAISLPSAPGNTPSRPTIELTTPPEPEPEPEPEKIALPDPIVTPDPRPSPRDDLGRPTVSKRPILRPETSPSPRPTAASAPKPKKAKPAATVRAASGSSKAQTSAGSGGSTQAGASGDSSVKTLGESQHARLQAVWGGKIRSRIARQKRFPRGTKGKGRVVLGITVARDGRVMSARVARSSGTAAFDKAAMSAVARAGRMPRAPKGLAQASYTFNLPVDFQ